LWANLASAKGANNKKREIGRESATKNAEQSWLGALCVHCAALTSLCAATTMREIYYNLKWRQLDALQLPFHTFY